jgi:hypothetical protein
MTQAQRTAEMIRHIASMQEELNAMHAALASGTYDAAGIEIDAKRVAHAADMVSRMAQNDEIERRAETRASVNAEAAQRAALRKDLRAFAAGARYR